MVRVDPQKEVCFDQPARSGLLGGTWLAEQAYHVPTRVRPAYMVPLSSLPAPASLLSRGAPRPTPLSCCLRSPATGSRQGVVCLIATTCCFSSTA